METKLCGWQPRCLDQFEASRQDFQTYSLFPFKIVPGEPIPSAILKFFEMEHDPYVIQLRKYMDWAHQMLMACWSSNGRVWEVRLRWNASVILHGQLEEKLNEVHSTACAPQSCKMSQVIQQIAPRLFFTNHQVYTGFTGTAKALSSWKFVNVQFAIVGTGGCGTTSLRKNLEQHPGVRFTYEGDDVLYAPGYNHLYQGGFRMLPTEEQVNQLKCGKGRCRAEDVDDRIIGLKNYNLYNFDVGLAALSLKRMKIILLVCDPLDRLEKALYYKHCQFTSRCENRSVIDEIVAGKDVAELVAEHREYWIASERIMFLMSLFKPPDVIIAHQEVLRTSPDFLYQTLFKQIGAGPFQMRFHRYNSVGGLRSGLCQRRKLLKEFQQALEPEYAKLEHLLTAIGHPKVKEFPRPHLHRRNELRSTRRCVNQRCE